MENKIKSVQTEIEQSEESLSSLDQKISNTSRQWDSLRLKLTTEIKDTQKTLREAEKAEYEKNTQRMKQLIEIGRGEFQKNPDKYPAHQPRIKSLSHDIEETTALIEFFGEKIRESKTALVGGTFALLVVFAGLLLIRSHFARDFSP